MKLQAAVLLLAGCAANLRAELATLPVAQAAAPMSETERLVRDSLAQALTKDLAQYLSSGRPAALLIAGDGVSERVIPAAFAGRLALVSHAQVKSLALRHSAGVQYFSVRTWQEKQTMSVDVAVLQAVPPGWGSLCCEDRNYLYEKKDGRWSLLGVEAGEF
jgi:hypothetical protein